MSNRKPNDYWTLEKCQEVILKCNTFNEIEISYPTAYRKYLKNKKLFNTEHIIRKKGLVKIGNRYDKLVIIESLERDKDFSINSNDRYWLCKCDCGKHFKITSKGLRRKSKFIKSCGCEINLKGNKNKNFKGIGEVSLRYFNCIKINAEKRNLEFNITIDYVWDLFLKQNRKCKFSGIELKFQSDGRSSNGTASLDRIDSNKGYVIGNVQWIHKNINEMKWDKSDKEFIKWCKIIAKYNKN